jgi:PAS domain-containing protein
MSGSQANPSTTSGAANGTNASATGGSNSQAGIRGVIDLESQATMLLDRHGVITYLDRNIAKVFDYAAQDLIGQLRNQKFRDRSAFSIC